jgi:hypothetical protein
MNSNKWALHFSPKLPDRDEPTRFQSISRAKKTEMSRWKNRDEQVEKE